MINIEHVSRINVLSKEQQSEFRIEVRFPDGTYKTSMVLTAEELTELKEKLHG